MTGPQARGDSAPAVPSIRISLPPVGMNADTELHGSGVRESEPLTRSGLGGPDAMESNMKAARICRRCGNTLVCASKAERFCSDLCRLEATQERHKRYYIANMADPGRREKKNKESREYYHTKKEDPAWLEVKREAQRKYRQKASTEVSWRSIQNEKKRERERIKKMVDPAYRDRKGRKYREWWQHITTINPDYRDRKREKTRDRSRKVVDLISVLRAEMPDLLKEFGL